MLQELSSLLDKAIEHLQSEFSGISVGRANPGIIEHVHVEAYGTTQPIKAVANISCPDTQTVRVEPWDKNMIGALEKAIRDADIGINPQNMGDSIFLPVPPLTEERRKQVIRKVKEIAEGTKVVIRNIRHDVLRKVKHQKDEKEISEDEASSLEKQIQEKVDQANKKVDDLTKTKETDVLSI